MPEVTRRDWEEEIRRRLAGLNLDSRREAEITEELAQHLEDRYEELRSSGSTAEEARRAALEELCDGSTIVKELRRCERPAMKDAALVSRRGSMFENLGKDLRYGMRMLWRNPGFTVVAVITLALGIGANTAIFSVVNAVILRPLPYADSERLVAVWGHDVKANDNHTYLSFDDLKDYRGQSITLEDLTGFTPQWSFTLTGSGEAERITGIFASASVFRLLGTRPYLGRGFSEEEDRPGSAPVAVLGHSLWQRRFGGDTEIVGKVVTLDDEKVTIVGVMPPGFRWLEEADIWRPLAQNSVLLRGRAVRVVYFAGRIKAGDSIVQAESELTAIAARLEREHPESNTGIRASVIPLHEEVTGKVRPALLVLLGAVGLVLLIACANVANLLLARSNARAREIAIRSSVGASRRRLIAQLFTESVLLALIAAAAGLLLAIWGVDLLIRLSPGEVPRRTEIRVDGTVLAFTFLLSVLTGLFFGMVPSLQASRQDPCDALKGGSRTAANPASRRATSLLVVAEVALSLVVLTASGLLLRSFLKLHGVDPGFNTESVLSFDLPMPSRYRDATVRLAFYRQLYARLEALPGVRAVGDVTRLPLAGRAGNPTSMLAIEGAPTAPGARPQVDFRRAGRDYFRAMGIQLVSGRYFDERDTPQTEPVAIINQIAARRYFPAQDPQSRRIGFGNAPVPEWYRVVGVVGDVRHIGLQTEPRPEMYIAASQAPPFAPVVVVRSVSSPESLVPAIRSVIRELDPAVAVFNVFTLQQIRYQSMAQPRFQVFLFGLFGGVALLLAIVGVYGVMAYSVAQRAHEVGIRMALGARREDVLRLVVAEGMKLAALGIALGIPAALAATRLMARLLYSVSPADALTYTGVSLLLAAAAMSASFIPARRASRLDPMAALRCE